MTCLLAATWFCGVASARSPSEQKLRANIPMGPLPAWCYAKPTGAICENGVLYNLDRARKSVGLASYKVPASFTRLSPEDQMLILTNLDRSAYGITPAAGLVPSLDTRAAEGVAVENDPFASAIPGGTILGYAANWAGEFRTVLEAYYVWMYDDGYPGENLDCSSPSSPGCWGHRRDTLFAIPGTTPLLGAAAGWSSRHLRGYAMLVVAAQLTHAPSYSYSWARAVADGAGRHPYNPGSVHKVTFELGGTGNGIIDGVNVPGARASCHHCSFFVSNKRETLMARPASGSAFTGWGGACAGRRRCTINPTRNLKVEATFALHAG